MTFNKAAILLFDVCQSKWTINAGHKHSCMLMFLWGSLMAPVVYVKCVLKNCIDKPSKQREWVNIHSLCLFSRRRVWGGNQNWQTLIQSWGNWSIIEVCLKWLTADRTRNPTKPRLVGVQFTARWHQLALFHHSIYFIVLIVLQHSLNQVGVFFVQAVQVQRATGGFLSPHNSF